MSITDYDYKVCVCIYKITKKFRVEKSHSIWGGFLFIPKRSLKRNKKIIAVCLVKDINFWSVLGKSTHGLDIFIVFSLFFG